MSIVEVAADCRRGVASAEMPPSNDVLVALCAVLAGDLDLELSARSGCKWIGLSCILIVLVAIREYVCPAEVERV